MSFMWNMSIFCICSITDVCFFPNRQTHRKNIYAQNVHEPLLKYEYISNSLVCVRAPHKANSTFSIEFIKYWIFYWSACERVLSTHVGDVRWGKNTTKYVKRATTWFHWKYSYSKSTWCSVECVSQTFFFLSAKLLIWKSFFLISLFSRREYFPISLFADMNQHKLNIPYNLHMTSSWILCKMKLKRREEVTTILCCVQPVQGILKQQNRLIDNGLEM